MESIAFVPADKGGCGFYRLVQPIERFAELSGKAIGHIQSGTTLPAIPAWQRSVSLYGLNAVHIQRPLEAHHLEYWRGFKRALPNVRLVMDFDDLLWNPDSSSTYKPTRQNIDSLDGVAKVCDRFTASTKPMAEAIFKRYGKRATVIPNMIADDKFQDIKPREGRLRILYAGSSTHQSDLEQLFEAVTETVDRYDWHFMGCVPKGIEGLVTVHTHVSLDEYLPYLHGIGAHVGIAPLISSPFNKCKSNLKLLEYGAIGLATISSDVYPYSLAPSVKCPFGTKSDWLNALASMEDEDYRMAQAVRSQEYAREFSLSRGDDLILKAYS